MPLLQRCRNAFVGTSLILACVTPPHANATDHTGVINTNTVWAPAENPHRIVDWVYVEGGATLEIQPGAVVEFVGS